MLYYITIILVLVGLSASTPIEERVIGGDETFDPHPYMVSVRRSGAHQCGGTIINPTWILTAAHCVYNVTATVTVQYGRKAISSTGNIAQVSSIQVHRDFYPQISTKNDIALLRLASPLSFDDDVQAVALPAPYQETGETIDGGVLLGWGFRTPTGSPATNLHAVTLDILSNDDCKERHLNKIYPSNICAGVEEGQCTRDGGGPLLVGDVQVGIVSWSVKPCGTAPYAGVFTRVSHYICWIRSFIPVDDNDRNSV